MSDLHFKTITELAAMLAAGETTSVAITQAVIDRTAAVDDKVKAFLSSDADDALAQAKASDERRAAGKAIGPLDGIPIGIKDTLAVKDQPLRCASKMLENYVSPFDATCIVKLREAGAVIWGRLNMDEFAMGSSTENSAYHTTCNPWDLETIPGGSSGGSAAAMAAGEAIATLGTDTGGSIRQPAALCGVVGMKPTYGLISRYGLVAFASSLDQVGPFARTVEDAALLMQAMLGKDPLDSTSIEQPEAPDYAAALKEKKGPWKLGVPAEFFGEGIDPEVKANIEKAIDWYKSQGCEIVNISLPHSELAVPVYYIVATAEASSNLARFDGVRYTHRSEESKDAMTLFTKSRGEGFGDEVKRRIILGTYVLSSGYYDAYYLRAQKVRRLILSDFEKAFEQVDAILTPTSPTPAFKRGERADDPLAMYLSDIYTISVNLAGLPAISIPSGFTESGLPIGLQVIGKAFGEADMFAVANAFEKAHDYAQQTPKL
ncbi:MAG: Asp-tRNA(Asn)/Glu-tRNA(Gln) amidotransferase subunit GatA [Opitutales bacterium]|jgi:aspartyl-tRNA(Asn)/glutamyl-tRNA(Gln) amidotransferase subunit A|nr:Asp-tRNA(Asn)/Glu-tRNA(Gln) amidotransferase subunit GatA [Opitutales bacterium]MDP4643166.1 Asp-tRNA(Asn)/Glu-tRNA(Gln) amidotransferase subunit GatA [Opitutales bacterium]MDP4776464.1 Asp-tRNA(Asn)/Glu-tRNA(Gln) amidotransferase subunit GatA [Opitutales bacterium]MDP4882563.1 Asp-tRNA(Asn)/Glu-tRNA(Gln) amidotransferase subunit GatA [Opitutales bacterium]MDP5079167.1 Asp-tRNA(Asn)/Glu-tRNA(Gln) amidotransferase subunit GatA [Opitutales bacterium]